MQILKISHANFLWEMLCWKQIFFVYIRLID